MEEDISAKLQCEVERMVRPVRAAYDTRQKMQEDLYAHLSALFEAERPGAKDDASAIRAACARLGDLDELRRRLQGSVSLWESLNWRLSLEFLPSWWRVGRRKVGESDVRRAARVASVQAALCVAMYAVIACAVLYGPLRSFSMTLPHPFLGGVWVGAINWGIFFAMHFLGPDLMDRAAEIGRRNSRWYALTLVGALFMLCCGFGVMASIGVAFEGSWFYRFNCLGGIFIVTSAISGRLLGLQFFGRRSEQWLALSTKPHAKGV